MNNYGFGLTFRETARLWAGFAVQSPRHFAAMAAILAYYATMAVLSWPLYLASSLYFLYRMSAPGNYITSFSTFPVKSHVLRLLQFNLIIEPRLRAFGTARAILARLNGVTGLKVGALSLVMSRLEAYAFLVLTSVPSFYAKHINLWVYLLLDGIPRDLEAFGELVEDYIYHEF